MTEKTTPAPTIKGKMPAKDFSMGFNVNKAMLPRNRTVTIDDSSVNSLSTFIWFGRTASFRVSRQTGTAVKTDWRASWSGPRTDGRIRGFESHAADKGTRQVVPG